MPFSDAALSDDRFLDGRLRVFQPRVGYRAATDPVFLAAAVPARAGETVLDLGCGVGVAGLCLAVRVPGLSLVGVEMQTDYAALARRNAARNGVEMEVAEADIAALPPGILGRSFDHVVMNPPWYRSDSPRALDVGRDAALREAAPFRVWADVALRRLQPGGRLTIVQLAERLGEILAALEGRASAAVLPLAPREGAPAGRVIVQARKGGRAPLRLLAPLVLHSGSAHERDGESFTPAAQAVLRHGEALPIGRR